MSLPQANASTSVSKGSNVSSLRPPLKPTQPQAPHPQLAPTTLIRPQPPRACPPLAPTRPQLPNTQQLQASTQSRVHTKSTAGPTKTSAQTVRKMPTQPRPAPPQPVWTPGECCQYFFCFFSVLNCPVIEQNRRPYPKPRPTVCDLYKFSVSNLSMPSRRRRGYRSLLRRKGPCLSLILFLMTRFQTLLVSRHLNHSRPMVPKFQTYKATKTFVLHRYPLTFTRY